MIRDLGFIAWKQSSAWMESMKGAQWNALVEKENRTFLEQIKEPKEKILTKAKDFEHAKKQIIFSYETIIINYKNSFEIDWYYRDDSSKVYTENASKTYTENASKVYTVSDVFIYDSKVYHVRDVGDGAQKYRLECLEDHKVLWAINNVGPNIFVKDNLCYYLGCENKLWYNKLFCVNAESGKEKKLIYEESNAQYNLSLVKGDKNCLFLLREDSGKQNLFVIEKDSIVYKNTVLQYYIPIGYHKNRICYLYSDGGVWKSSGFTLKKHFSNEVLYASLSNNIILLSENGLRKMYDFDFKLLHTYYGNCIYNSWIEKHFEKYYIDLTGAGVVEYKYHKPVECTTYYGTVKRLIVNHVPVIVVKPHCKPSGLMCIGYGGYGLPTNMSTTRWKPYIDAGWMLAFVCVRGSGDVNKLWANEARTYNKIASFIDFETSIKAIQQKYHITAKHTCIYGRSAGGYLVGGVISRNPTGNLFKMVYSEVPYVDLLRTTSNPSLPLTALEYNEFGNPATGIQEFRTLLNYSPVDSLDFDNPPDLFVIIHTSENDSQVYTYESYKWLEALRGRDKSDKRKIVYCTKGKGHFVNSYEIFSQDFFLLNSFRT